MKSSNDSFPYYKQSVLNDSEKTLQWYCDAYAGVDVKYCFFNTLSFYDILIFQWVWLILLGNNLSLTLIQMVDHLWKSVGSEPDILLMSYQFNALTYSLINTMFILVDRYHIFWFSRVCSSNSKISWS